jgi:hypothetical protein
MTLAADARRLREFDACAQELRQACVERFEAGGAVAAAEIETLTRLSRTLVGNVGQWRSLAGDLDLCERFDADRAGRLVLESVFDEVLSPEAWRLLAAAFALDMSAE